VGNGWREYFFELGIGVGSDTERTAGESERGLIRGPGTRGAAAEEKLEWLIMESRTRPSYITS